jgi:hypothetical protein
MLRLMLARAARPAATRSRPGRGLSTARASAAPDAPPPPPSPPPPPRKTVAQMVKRITRGVCGWGGGSNAEAEGRATAHTFFPPSQPTSTSSLRGPAARAARM